MKYFGITLGPLYKTFSNVRHTRELWAASFCFSFLMRRILRRLIDEQIVSKEEVLQPYIEDDASFEKPGIGLFPDRIIIKTDNLPDGKLNEIFDNAIADLGGEIFIFLQATASREKIFKFLKDYFQLSVVSAESERKLDNPILEISPYLDDIEQITKYVTEDYPDNYLKRFFLNVNKGNERESFLNSHYEIQDVNGNKRVESLVEIATRELKGLDFYKDLINIHLWDRDKKEDKDEEIRDKKKAGSDTAFLNAVVAKLKAVYENNPEQNPFRAYHKYICILKADGDKIGAHLRTLRGEKEVQAFSTHLIQWANETYDKLIKPYGGIPIFIGGDDLLCIVPVCNGEKNVFTLITEIDSVFDKAFKDTGVSLSFGASISHYKYPLSETLVIADDLLRKAKQAGGNRIAIQLMKHGGSKMVSILDKTSDIYNISVRKQLLQLLNGSNEESAKTINNAVLYKIRDNHCLLESILSDSQRVVNFFNNYFDITAGRDESYENITEENGYKDPLKEKYFFILKELTNKIYETKKNALLEKYKKELTEEVVKEVFSIFRIVKFIKGCEDDKE